MFSLVGFQLKIISAGVPPGLSSEVVPEAVKSRSNVSLIFKSQYHVSWALLYGSYETAIYTV
jgi:hypothetical protein